MMRPFSERRFISTFVLLAVLVSAFYLAKITSGHTTTISEYIGTNIPTAPCGDYIGQGTCIFASQPEELCTDVLKKYKITYYTADLFTGGKVATSYSHEEISDCQFVAPAITCQCN